MEPKILTHLKKGRAAKRKFVKWGLLCMGKNGGCKIRSEEKGLQEKGSRQFAFDLGRVS